MAECGTAMSTTDLQILTDAVTFAILACLGGALAYVVVRYAWRHLAGSRALKLGMSAGALLAILLAGAAVWPGEGEGDNVAAGPPVDLAPTTDVSSGPDEAQAGPVPAPSFEGSRIIDLAKALGDRVAGADGRVEPTPGDSGTTGGDGGGNGGGGSGGGGGDGGGGGGGGGPPSPSPSPSPDPDPSPSPDPEPSPSPSPTPDPEPSPSPSPEPSATPDPA